MELPYELVVEICLFAYPDPHLKLINKDITKRVLAIEKERWLIVNTFNKLRFRNLVFKISVTGLKPNKGLYVGFLKGDLTGHLYLGSNHRSSKYTCFRRDIEVDDSIIVGTLELYLKQFV